MKEDDGRSYGVELYNFYSPLQTRDPSGRRHFLDELDKTLKELLDEQESIKANICFRKHLPVVLRLSYECPFPDVREYCAKILQELEVGTFIFLRP